MTHTIATLDNQGQGTSVSYINGKSKAIRGVPVVTLIGLQISVELKGSRYLIVFHQQKKFKFS